MGAAESATVLDLAYLPTPIREARRWLLHDRNKVPHYVDGERRCGALDGPEDVSRLATLDDTLQALHGRPEGWGAGFALGFDQAHGAHWQGVDFDHVLDADGAFTDPTYEGLYRSVVAYAERSLSGDGVHVLGLGQPFRAMQWPHPRPKGSRGIECYSAGRYFAMTGDVLRQAEIMDLHDAVEAARSEFAAQADRARPSMPSVPRLRTGGADATTANIDAFVRDNPIEAALARYGFTRHGTRWLSPRSETGLPGVRVLDDGRAVSWHASDAGLGTAVAGDQARIFDAFDLAVFHDFGGDRLRAVRELLPRRTTVPAKVHPSEHSDGCTASQDAADGRLRALPAGAFVRAFVPPVYVLDPIIVRGQVVAITGQPNVGKSAIAVPLSLAAAGVLTLPGVEADACRVLYLIGENDSNLAVQLIAACERWSIDPATLDGRLWVVPQRFGLGPMVGEIAALATAVGGFGLVVVDTRIAYSESLDENDNQQAAEDARALRDLARVEGEPAVLALCHPPKNAQREALYPRGGSAFFGEIDANLTLWNDGDTVEMASNKRRMPEFDAIVWRLEQVETTRRDRKGRPVRSVVASIVGDVDTHDDNGRRQDDNRMLWALLHHPDASVAEWAVACGWTYKGNPAKSKVDRVLKRLQAADLARRYGDRWTLTAPGKTLARGVK